MSRNAKSPQHLAQEELSRVEYSNINIWLIIKDNELAGKITARESATVFFKPLLFCTSRLLLVHLFMAAVG